MNRDLEIAPTNDATPLYEAVVGPRNTGYYLAYFRRADTRGYAPVSWHWPAFFFGFFWLLYRRQYRWALIFMAVSLTLTAAASMLLASGAGGWVTPAYYVAMLAFQMVYVPLQANAIYYGWARHEVAAAQTAFPGQPRQQAQHLASRGGVLGNIGLIAAASFAALMMLSQALQRFAE